MLLIQLDDETLLHRETPSDKDDFPAAFADAFSEVEKDGQREVIVVLLPEGHPLSEVATEDDFWGARLVEVAGLSQPVLIGTARVKEPVEKKTALERARIEDAC